MDYALDRDEARVAEIKADLRERGWLLRYTEWPLGHQVVLHARPDPSRHLVTEWYPAEVDAWEAAHRLADAQGLAREAVSPPGQDSDRRDPAVHH